jgi:hypothetical protein
MVDAIYLELHLGSQMSTPEDLAKWASMYHVLFEREGFKLWWVHPNAARAPGANMHPALRRLPYSTRTWEPGAPPMAWEIGLRRMPVGGAAAVPLLRCPKSKRQRGPIR